MIACLQNELQIKIELGAAMERALRRWLDSHGLFAIAAAVLGVIVALSVLIVLGLYLSSPRTAGPGGPLDQICSASILPGRASGCGSMFTDHSS